MAANSSLTGAGIVSFKVFALLAAFSERVVALEASLKASHLLIVNIQTKLIACVSRTLEHVWLKR